ncbi:MAG: hypothetical protein JJ974_11210, partial [Phycisphaerales bacterium]|nr:hypothetical protein [Phycisphaerales bacterium]
GGVGFGVVGGVGLGGVVGGVVGWFVVFGGVVWFGVGVGVGVLAHGLRGDAWVSGKGGGCVGVESGLAGNQGGAVVSGALVVCMGRSCGHGQLSVASGTPGE